MCYKWLIIDNFEFKNKINFESSLSLPVNSNDYIHLHVQCRLRSLKRLLYLPTPKYCRAICVCLLAVIL